MNPNILVIFADQMRGDCMGCAGHPLVKTPNLDKLAATGVMFENAYSPDPVCVPARASFTTGKYPHKCTGIKANGGRILDDQIKMPELLAENGYATFASGKLHYVPYAAPGEERLLHGFQKCVLAESGRIINRFDPKGETRGLEDYHDYLKDVGWAGFERAHGVGNNDIHPAPAPMPAEHYVDSWVCTQAIQMLDEHLGEKATADQPFFMFMSFPKPHAPYDPPRPYDAMYDPRDVPPPLAAAEGNMCRTPNKFQESITHGWDLWSPQMSRIIRAYYYGMVSFQDHQIGRMLSFLEKHDALKDTIVVYTADHGDLLGDFGFYAKSCFYNGSVKVPMLIRWPDKVRAGVKSDALVGLQDLLPTLTALADIQLPDTVDGCNLMPLLQGDAFTEREFFISYYNDDPQQLYMIADKRFKYIYSQLDGVEELYDLQNDPDELVNLAEQAEQRELMNEYQQLMKQWAIENQDDAFLKDGRLKVNQADTLKEVAFRQGSMGWRWH